MTIIKQQDLIDSVTDALQFISFYHPVDFIQAVHEAYEREESKAAKDAMAQILVNSRMCAEGHRPICQDTGIVTVFIRVGMDVQWDAEFEQSLEISRGLASGDLDDDGGLDLLVSNLQSAPRLYRNDAPRAGGWLTVRAVDPRYRRHAITAARTLAELGVQIVAITDGPLSPLASLTDHWCELKVPAIGPFDSSVPAVAMAELLVAHVATQLRDDARARIDRTEALWEATETFLP